MLLIALAILMSFEPTREWLLTGATYVLAVVAGVALTTFVLCGGGRSHRS